MAITPDLFTCKGNTYDGYCPVFLRKWKCKNIGESEPAKDRQQENTFTSLFSLILSCSSVLTPKEPE